jgi:hypothetical protein
VPAINARHTLSLSLPLKLQTTCSVHRRTNEEQGAPRFEGSEIVQHRLKQIVNNGNGVCTYASLAGTRGVKGQTYSRKKSTGMSHFEEECILPVE